MRVIGMMSGTSLDGIDIALLETDGENITALGPTDYRAYSPEEREVLLAALADGPRVRGRQDRPGRLVEAERLITSAHVEALERFLAAHGLKPGDIDAVGFHGQTVIHRPEEGFTLQIGRAQDLAARSGLRVVHDLRLADMAAGGQGAPLVPVFHRALARKAGFETPLAILNLGGVANVTLIGRGGELLAFDAGPANALIDDWMRERADLPFDENGACAAAGRPDEALLAWLMTHPFFAKPPPKSLDRNWFSHRIAAHLPLEDGAATLTAFSARSTARALDFVRERPKRWIVAGGGARNAEMLRLLALATGAEMVVAEQVGWSAEFLEAQAFAYLAARSLTGKPITFPTTTGVKDEITGGVVAEP